MNRFLFLILLLWMTTADVALGAVGDDPIQSLKAVITDLKQTFGSDYPDADRYLSELNQLQKRLTDGGKKTQNQSQAELKKLKRKVVLSHPLLGQSILFVARPQYKSDHHSTATLFQNGEVNTGSFHGGSALKTVDLQTGKVTTLLTVPAGIVRDPELSYDGKQVVFSMRRNRQDDYHIYTMRINGSGLKQLTFGKELADIDPDYLPDGRLVFTSTRDTKYCQCNRHIMANMFTMEADGANPIQIGGNGLFEGHPHVMPDGRILYDRWEYVDRQFGPSFGLWTVNPDGSNHQLFYGNNAWAPGAILDARVIPGSVHVVCIFGSCHDRPWGAMAVVDQSRGMDGSEPVLRIWPTYARKWLENQNNIQWNPGGIDVFKRARPRYEDPYPLAQPVTNRGAGQYFLVSRTFGKPNSELMGLYYVDVFGNEQLLHVEKPGCYDPMPVAPRSLPMNITSRVDLKKQVGTFYVYDVYKGTGMEQVKRGAIKYLRIVEAPYKRYWTHTRAGIDATQAPAINWNLTNNKRIIGDVPVEADGSAHFTVPANRFVYFQALDKNKMMVQSMRSGTIVQGGEVTGCIGCHEKRSTAVPNIKKLAFKRLPSKPATWFGPTRRFNFLTEVQPVFDRHCVICHDYGKPAGEKINLAGDVGLMFNTSYMELNRKSAVRWQVDKPGKPKRLINAVHDGPPGVLPAYAWGSHRSKLMDVVTSKHNEVKLSREEIQRIATWIDMNAPYYGAYSAVYRDNLFGRSPLDDDQIKQLQKLSGIKNIQAYEQKHGSLISFDRPWLSPILQLIKARNPQSHEVSLALIEAGAKQLKNQPREDMLGVKAAAVSGDDRYRQGRFQRQAQIDQRVRQAISTRRKVYPYRSNTNQ